MKMVWVVVLKDYLRCQGFVNNAKALKGENYQNIKTQCYYKLADMINKAQSRNKLF